jgi:hypothetical protein
VDDIGRTFFCEGEKPGIDYSHQTGEEGSDPEGDGLQEIILEFFIPDPVKRLFPQVANPSDECHIDKLGNPLQR